MTTKEELEIAFANSIIQRDRLEQENQKLKEYVDDLVHDSMIAQSNLMLEISKLKAESQAWFDSLEVKRAEYDVLKAENEELLDWTINYGEYVIYGLRSEIEELKKKADEYNKFMTHSKWHNTFGCSPYITLQKIRKLLKGTSDSDRIVEKIEKLEQESKQAIEVVKRLEDNIFNELAFHQIFWDCVNDNDVDPNKIEYKLRKKLQSILKGEKI